MAKKKTKKKNTRKKKRKSNNTLLWEISGKKLKSPCYLFGTMHVRDKRAFPGTKKVLKKINSCEAFASEFDIAEADPSKFTHYMQLPDEQRLSQLIKPKTYKALGKLLKKSNGMDISQLDTSRPLLLVNLLTESYFQKDMPEALDHYLYNYAKEKGKQISGIETFEEQLSILQSISIKEQLKSLSWTVNNFKAFKKQLKKTAALYEEMDLQKLYKTAKSQAKGMRKVMIYQRNAIMAKRIAKKMKKASTFVAIGAGHLPGEKGVLRLLKERGYDVKPVKLD